MGLPIVAPYGCWESPINLELVASHTIGLGKICIDSEDIFWIEARPYDKGRNVIVKRFPDSRTSDITSSPFSAQSTVYEYGGSAYTVAEDIVYFVNYSDQQIYRLRPDCPPEPLTTNGDRRYADLILDKKRNRLLCICEDHHNSTREPQNYLVQLNLDEVRPARVLISGADFYSSPALSPNGDYLAWLSWNHPYMPWDVSELWVGRLTGKGEVKEAGKVAGGERESIFQPSWSPDGILYFVSDRNGWWNIFRRRQGKIESVSPMEAEFARPQWYLGMPTYAFVSAEMLVCTFVKDGFWSLACLSAGSGSMNPVESPYTEMWGLQASTSAVVFHGGSPTNVASIASLKVNSKRIDVLRRSSEMDLDVGYLSKPEFLEFPSTDGQTAYGFFYAPQNRDYAAPSGELPPLLVMCHGGPTASSTTILSWDIQFWTSRGIAVLQVDYGGSSGYGRAYRERLYGRWGIVDVEDCIQGALYLVGKKRVDGRRLAIRGGSAGGFTALAAIAFHDVFQGAVVYSAVSDLEDLVKTTHKFESHYLERLVGPYPQAREVYRSRSPLYFADRINCPVLLFHGEQDRVVPPQQARLLVETLLHRKIPVKYVSFADEGHGLRQTRNIRRAYRTELAFYSKLFGFPLNAVSRRKPLVE